MEIIEMREKNLPNSTTVLVLGIIAVALASAPWRVYLKNPEEYTEASYKNLNAGRVFGIIGICIALVVVAFLMLVILGIMAKSGIVLL